MSRLIETIRLSDGAFSNLPYHVARMERAWKELFHTESPWSLQDVLGKQEIPKKGLFKCRVRYDLELRAIEFTPYTIKPVKTLRLIHDDSISYAHKSERRSSLDRLFAQRGECDDVLIIKNGMVTDTSYANILFKKGDEWFTPESCLLSGTMRQSLIDKKEIRVQDIAAKDIQQFDKMKLINAMLMLDAPEIDIDGVR